MGYEDRSASTGSHAMKCDVPGCKHECISPTMDDLHEDMTLAGWIKHGEDEHGHKLFQCPTCGEGIHPAKALLHAVTGGTGEVTVEAPMSVSKGDAFYTSNGELLGHYTDDAEQGEDIQVEVQLPDPSKPVSSVELYDDMMEGSDDNDDAHGRVSAVAPVVGPMVNVVGEPSQATDGSGGGVGPVRGIGGTANPGSGARRIDQPYEEQSPADQARLRRTLADTSTIFDDIDPSATDWDPDA